MTKGDLARYRLDFLDYLLDIRGYSDLTVKSYDEALREAMPLVEVVEEAESFTIELMPYRLVIAPLKPRTISKKISAWRSYVAFMKLQGEKVTLRSDESIKVPKTLPKPVTHEHVAEALAQADVRERMVLMMLYTLGLRLSELHGLKLDQIGSEWVRVRGKGDKVRDIPMVEAAAAAVDAYTEMCRPRAFLCECGGKRLSENSLRYLVNRAFKRVGLKVTPHQLRHAYATELLNHDARIADVSELLGHASMATTQIYTKLGSALKLQHYHNAHPLCKESDGFE